MGVSKLVLMLGINVHCGWRHCCWLSVLVPRAHRIDFSFLVLFSQRATCSIAQVQIFSIFNHIKLHLWSKGVLKAKVALTFLHHRFFCLCKNLTTAPTLLIIQLSVLPYLYQVLTVRYKLRTEYTVYCLELWRFASLSNKMGRRQFSLWMSKVWN